MLQNNAAEVLPAEAFAEGSPARPPVREGLPVPTLEELLPSIHVVALPLNVPFRGVTVREAMLFRGPRGWTEFSPFLEYGIPEAATWLAGAIEGGWARPAKAVRETVPVNATVPAVPARRVPGVLEAYGPVQTVKVKVGGLHGDLEADEARVHAVRRTAGDTVRIRVDANGTWSLAEAREAIRRLSQYGLEYVEQPVAGLEDLARIRGFANGLDVAIAADESIRKTGDPQRVARLEAADVLVLKVQPLGGAARAREVAQSCGLPVVVSSALDTSVGIGLGAELASSLPELPHACGLGTAALFREDVCATPAVPVDGRLGIARPVPDPDRLVRLAASPERRAWWMRRLSDCLEELRHRSRKD